MLDWVVVTNTWSSPKFAHVFLGQKPKFAAHYIHNKSSHSPQEASTCSKTSSAKFLRSKRETEDRYTKLQAPCRGNWFLPVSWSVVALKNGEKC